MQFGTTRVVFFACVTFVMSFCRCQFQVLCGVQGSLTKCLSSICLDFGPDEIGQWNTSMLPPRFKLLRAIDDT